MIDRLREWRRFGVAMTVATLGFLAPLDWIESAFPASPMEEPWFLVPVDKLVHLVAFGVLTWLGLRAVSAQVYHADKFGHKGSATRFSHYLWLGSGLVLYAVLIECVQGVLPTRGFEALDVVADAAGCLLAAALWSRRALR